MSNRGTFVVNVSCGPFGEGSSLASLSEEVPQFAGLFDEPQGAVSLEEARGVGSSARWIWAACWKASAAHPHRRSATRDQRSSERPAPGPHVQFPCLPEAARLLRRGRLVRASHQEDQHGLDDEVIEDLVDIEYDEGNTYATQLGTDYHITESLAAGGAFTFRCCTRAVAE